MKHSALARLIAGTNATATRHDNDKQPARQTSDTGCKLHNDTEAIRM